MRNRLGLAAFALVVLIAPRTPARADDGDLDTLIGKVSDTLLPNMSHAAHFEVANAGENIDLINGINQAIAGQFSTVPLGSSAGGFTSTIDAATGVGTRNSTTFGPQFAERALTIGKHKFDIGVQYLHASYDALNGTNIKDGSLTYQLVHEDESGTGRQDPNFFWQGDVMTNQLQMDLQLDTALIVGTFGVTDRFDLGLVLPYVKSQLDVVAMKTLEPLATGVVAPSIHQFSTDINGDPIYTGSAAASGSASGIGDVVLRGKYNFLDPKKGSGLALALDARLPTGDEHNFLGTGATQAKLYLIGSWNLDRFSPHFNFGYTATFGSSSIEVPDEINYVGGFEVECHPRVSLVSDVIGRYLLNAFVTKQTSAEFLAFDFSRNGGAGAVYSSTLPQVNVEQADQNLLQEALGLKINPGGKWLISVGALFPIGRHGLTSDVAGVVGFNYSF